MRKLVFLITFISSLTYGQCPDYDKLETGGTYLARTNNYIPLDPNIPDTIQYCCDLKRIKKYSEEILNHSKNYITKRGGENFYRNLELESIEVNYPKDVKVVYENKELYKLENYDVQYWIKYTYQKDTYKYAFCLLFDKAGNMISENKFPDISKNPSFENYKNPCEALNLVKSDEKFQGKKIDFIELAFVEEINSFCWLVKEKKLPTKLGINEYTLDSYFVNANTNKLEKLTVENVTGIACGIGKTTTEKRK